MKTIIAAALLLAAPLGAQLAPEDFEYLGSFAPPQRSCASSGCFAYGLFGMDYVAGCLGAEDPSPDDGYPGCLIATSHKNGDKVAVFDIPAPIIPESQSDAYYRESLPKGSLVVDFFDPSAGIKDAVLDPQPGWVARDIPGVIAVADETQLIVTCGHDWYNVNETDYASHCWTTVADQSAVGAWNFGPEGDIWTHSQRMAWYLGRIPQAWADDHLDAGGEPWCFSGMQRANGGKPNQSAGPSMLAFPCAEPDVAPEGPLPVKPLLNYEHVYPSRPSGYLEPLGVPDGHSAKTQTRGIEWIDEAIIVSRKAGGPYWWYGHRSPYEEPRIDEDPPVYINHRNTCAWNGGDPVWMSGPNKGQSCHDQFFAWGPPIPEGVINDPQSIRDVRDPCASGKGYHSIFPENPRLRAELLLYDSDDIAEVVASDTDDIWPNKPRPYATVSGSEFFWGIACHEALDLAYDPESRTLFWGQARGSRPVIHALRVNAGPADTTCDVEGGDSCLNDPANCGPCPPCPECPECPTPPSYAPFVSVDEDGAMSVMCEELP
jgi:hypothetical protein